MNKWLFPKLWQNICFEETVCFYTDENGIEKGGSLLYEPLKIESMTSWDESVQFTENNDFVIEGNVIKRLENSKIPLMQFDVFSHTNDGNISYQWLCNDNGTRYIKPFNEIYKYQIKVTYTTESEGMFGSKIVDASLNKTIYKLQRKKPVNILFYGDSITAGWEASGQNEDVINKDDLTKKHEGSNRYPFMPAWPQLVVDALKEHFDYDDIFKINRSASGSTSEWGAESAERLIKDTNPDLAIVAFGMNNMSISPEKYKQEVDKIITNIRMLANKSEILLISPMVANYDMIRSFKNEKTVDHERCLYELSREYEGVFVLPINNIFRNIEKRKGYMSLTGNCINHPNDYSVRIYAQAILELFGI